MSKRHQGYPPEVKAKAREVYEEQGSAAASQATGVGLSTVRGWAKDEHWRRHLATAGVLRDATAEHSRLVITGWRVRRRRMGDEAGQAAAELLALLRERTAKGTIYGLEAISRSFELVSRRADELTAGTGGTEEAMALEQSETIVRMREMAATLRERAKAAPDD